MVDWMEKFFRQNYHVRNRATQRVQHKPHTIATKSLENACRGIKTIKWIECTQKSKRSNNCEKEFAPSVVINYINCFEMKTGFDVGRSKCVSLHIWSWDSCLFWGRVSYTEIVIIFLCILLSDKEIMFLCPNRIGCLNFAKWHISDFWMAGPKNRM